MSHRSIAAHRTTSRSLRALVAVLVTLALLATGLIRPAPAASAPLLRILPMGLTETSYARTVMQTLNDQRSAHGLKRLRLSLALSLAAGRHNAAMARANTISHQLRGERDFVARGRLAGWRIRCATGENIGVSARMDRGGAVELQKLMYGERPPYDGHRQNILSSRYTHVGVAVLVDRRNQRVWLTTDFGQRRC